MAGGCAWSLPSTRSGLLASTGCGVSARELPISGTRASCGWRASLSRPTSRCCASSASTISATSAVSATTRGPAAGCAGAAARAGAIARASNSGRRLRHMVGLLAWQGGGQLAPAGQFRLAFDALAEEADDAVAVGVERFDGGDDAVAGGAAHQPGFVQAAVLQVQVEAGVEDVQPLADALHALQRAGMDLHHAAVADKHHDRQRAVGGAAQQ